MLQGFTSLGSGSSDFWGTTRIFLLHFSKSLLKVFLTLFPLNLINKQIPILQVHDCDPGHGFDGVGVQQDVLVPVVDEDPPEVGPVGEEGGPLQAQAVALGSGEVHRDVGGQGLAQEGVALKIYIYFF